MPEYNPTGNEQETKPMNTLADIVTSPLTSPHNSLNPGGPPRIVSPHQGDV